MGKRYKAFVKADAGLVIEAESKEEARERLENSPTGVLGPPTVNIVEPVDDDARQE